MTVRKCIRVTAAFPQRFLEFLTVQDGAPFWLVYIHFLQSPRRRSELILSHAVSTSHLSYAQQYCAIVVTQWRIETLYSKQQNWNLMTNSILLIFMIYRFNGKKKNTLKKTSTFLAVENVNCPFGNETESCIGDKQWRSHCRGIIRVSQSCSICNGCLGVTIQPINHRR